MITLPIPGQNIHQCAYNSQTQYSDLPNGDTTTTDIPTSYTIELWMRTPGNAANYYDVANCTAWRFQRWFYWLGKIFL